MPELEVMLASYEVATRELGSGHLVNVEEAIA